MADPVEEDPALHIDVQQALRDAKRKSGQNRAAQATTETAMAQVGQMARLSLAIEKNTTAINLAAKQSTMYARAALFLAAVAIFVAVVAIATST